MSDDSRTSIFEQDHLTDPARAALRENVQFAYSSLVPTDPHEGARGPLEQLSETGAVKQAVDRRMDACVQSALWLWHDFLGESHTLSQGIEMPEGSWWHGIMHRREGDFSNAKYWFRRVGAHPLFQSLAVRADDLIRDEPADKMLFALTRQGWDPYAFIDLCETASAGEDAPYRDLAIALQQLEWRTLFDFCVRGARGG